MTIYPIRQVIYLGFFLCTSAAFGSLISYQNDFSVNAAGWVSVGSTLTSVSRAVSDDDWDKNDLLPPNGVTPGVAGTFGTLGYEATGDGVRNDGALFMNTVNAVTGDEAIGYTVGGTMDVGERISFKANMFNGNNSFMSVVFQLYNLTDSQVLASTSTIGVQGQGSATYVPVDIALDYTALATDAGDTLQIRFVDNANNTARNLWIDELSLVSVPEPGTFLGLLGVFVASLFRREKRAL